MVVVATILHPWGGKQSQHKRAREEFCFFNDTMSCCIGSKQPNAARIPGGEFFPYYLQLKCIPNWRQSTLNFSCFLRSQIAGQGDWASLWLLALTHQQREADIGASIHVHGITTRAMLKVWVSLSAFKQKNIHAKTPDRKDQDVNNGPNTFYYSYLWQC